MGREAECDSAMGLDMEWQLGRMALVSPPRTPLRVLLARESGGTLWTHGADLPSPGGKPGEGKGASPMGSLFGLRMGHVSHKIRLFKKAQEVAERPVHLGALFAQEARDEAAQVQQPLRDLIAAELWAGPGMRRVADGRSPTSPSLPRVPEAAKPDESQELRYLFAKDWALQTSDEEDDFWDSGSLCGATPLLSRSLPRRRSRFYKNVKLSSSSRAEPEREIVEVEELRAQSPESRGPKSSLGSLLAVKVATSSGSPLADSRWSSAPAAESSQRVKIGSRDDISTPVRPESQSQLDFLIAKILTLRANSNNGGCSTSGINDGCSASGNNSECFDSRTNDACSVSRTNGGCSVSLNNGGCTASATNDGCSASGSMQMPADVTLGDEESNETSVAPAAGVNSSIVDTPNFLNPPSAETGEPAPWEAPALCLEAPVTEAVEPIKVDEASRNPDCEDGEATPRVQLGTLLERSWSEHGWLPLGRSGTGSPLPAPSSFRSHCEEPPGPSPAAEAVEVPPAEAEPSGEEAEPSGEAPEPTGEAPEASGGAPEASGEAPEASGEAPEARPATRVSLLSLLSQDMEADEEGLLAGAGGRRDEEEDEVVTEELDPMCCVCMVGHKGAAFIPCGHTFCRKCCREVRRSIGSCPLCNQTIADVLNLY